MKYELMSDQKNKKKTQKKLIKVSSNQNYNKKTKINR